MVYKERTVPLMTRTTGTMHGEVQTLTAGASEIQIGKTWAGPKSSENSPRPQSRNRNATVPILPRTDKLGNPKKAWGIITEPPTPAKTAGLPGSPRTKPPLMKSRSLPARGEPAPRLGESALMSSNYFYDREHFLKTGRHRYRLSTDKSSREFKQVCEDMFVEKHGCPGTVEKKKINRSRWGRAVAKNSAALGFMNLAKLGANRRAASSNNLLAQRESVLMRATSKIFSVPEEVKSESSYELSEKSKKGLYNVSKVSPRTVLDASPRSRLQRRASVLSIGSSRPPSRTSEDRIDPAVRGWNMLKSTLRDAVAMERANIKTPEDLQRAKSDLFERYASPPPVKPSE